MTAAEPPARLWKIATDTGGTFTDCWGLTPDGREVRCKLLSSGCLRSRVEAAEGNRLRLRDSWDLPDGFFRGFLAETGGSSLPVAGWIAAERTLILESVSASIKPGDALELSTGEAAAVVGARMLTRTPPGSEFPPLEFRLSTTLATNALLEGKTAPVAFFVTRGFGDLLKIGDQRRPHLFALRHETSKPLTTAVVEVGERMDAEGRILADLDAESLQREAERLAAAGFSSAAVAFIHSYCNPQHERKAREILLAAGFRHVSLSAEISPLIRFLARSETVVMEAALAPVMQQFIASVRTPLGTSLRRLFCLSSAGGLTKPEEYRAKDSLLSGPAGGVAGCASVARSAGARKILTIDMGGTSTDVARWEGAFLYQFEQRIGTSSILAPSLRIETVAAGGGSICDVTAEGLAVGPHSAGANPGPACYGHGGPLTLTDVNLLLERMDPEQAAVPLWPESARLRLTELKQKLSEQGWPVPADDRQLLRGLLDIAIERMAEAVRRISVREGCDPREYSLVAFGGAGPQHACAIADRLGITEILVPRQAGILSACGTGSAAQEVIAVKQVLQPLAPTLAALPDILHELEAEALHALPAGLLHRQLAELRLQGQDTCLTVDFSNPNDLARLFADRYAALYGYPPPPQRTVELVTLRVLMRAAESVPLPEAFSDASPRIGPACIQDGFSTLIVEPGWSAEQGSLGTWRLRRTPETVTRHLPSPATSISAVDAELFRCRFSGLVEGMGALLQRTAISTNVRERLDFSCALLDADGRLVMNAPHIPVHLGALGECVRKAAAAVPPQDGEIIVTNDPACAGSHLPDVTVICPVFDDTGTLLAYTANRAHHAEIGGISPGSMPAFARNLAEEGILIRPQLLTRHGDFLEQEMANILTSGPHPTRSLADNLADLRAQVASARLGRASLLALCRIHGADAIRQHLRRLCQTASQALQRKLAASTLTNAVVEESLDDGWKIRIRLALRDGRISIDFAGSSPVHPGSRNATTAVVRSAVLYALRLWIQEDIPLNEGILDQVELTVPPGFLHPDFSQAPQLSPPVVAGNVETSQRIVDALLKALQLQACSQGTMNNVIFGSDRFGHYETIGGGSGAGPGYAGASGLHTHMTNTAITDVEILEQRYPVRIERFSLRSGSGGAGRWRGGEGLIREYRFLAPLTVSLLTEHRLVAPYGLDGGLPGECGQQELFDPAGNGTVLPGSITLTVSPGELLRIETPGGGGCGPPI